MTKNFNISEFECKCGCEMPPEVYSNIIKLANQLQILRDYLGKPIKITNAYRCEKHNKEVGGVKNSQHLFGKAADIQVKGKAPEQIAFLINNLIDSGQMLQGGVGIYNTFVHYDFRKTKVRWDYRK